MDEAVASDPVRRDAAWLAVVAAAGLIAYLTTPADSRSRVIVAQVAIVVTSLVGGWVTRRAGVRQGWPSARHLSWALVLVGGTEAVFLGLDLSGPGAYTPRISDLAFLIFLVPLLLALRDELRAHFEPRERREIAIDVGLITASLAVIAYTFLRPADASSAASSTAGVFAILAATQFTVYAALTVWVPTKAHLLQFLVFTAYGLATLQFGWAWSGGRLPGPLSAGDLAFMLCPLALAGVVAVVRHDPGTVTVDRAHRIARPVLTSMAVVAASAALAVVAIFDESRGLQGTQATVIIGLLGVGVAARILSNQMASTQAHGEVRDALGRQEEALHEADMALDRVREANETLRRSEEHLRLVFDTAVDGIVELDDEGAVVRANEAFGKMVSLDRHAIEGQSWSALAASIDGADPGFASLPVTGQAQIHRIEGQPLYLESRVSEVPTVPPRRLLLVRDVTAATVADQTIRSLFQFLQDRDEDRTRLLRRTNAAIESERNRVARDLHDGPVQGVSAASLSLEAALLMIKAGEVDRGLSILTKIRTELAEEADALRRLMSGLRPPVLEERGLMPALRETLVRFGAEHKLETSFGGSLARPVPDDLETLAYRVVQEALANATKHADANYVSVHVDSDATQLRVEVEDDGAGFDIARTREFLHQGRVGLASMRERVELASGTFAVRSSPGRGTTIIATLPLDTSSASLATS